MELGLGELLDKQMVCLGKNTFNILGCTHYCLTLQMLDLQLYQGRDKAGEWGTSSQKSEKSGGLACVQL